MNDKKEALAASKYESLFPNLADYVSHYSGKRKGKTALVEFDTGEKLSWKKFNQSVDAFAAKLLASGFKKGDIIATSLPLLKERHHAFC